MGDADFVSNLRELVEKQAWWIDRVREIRDAPNAEAKAKSTIFEGILNSGLPKEDLSDKRLSAEAQLIIFAGEGTTGK